MSYPSVSVVIPCFNVESYIKEAIESVLAQDHPIQEILCVDNGSSDSTLEVLRGFDAIDKVKILHESNRGAPSARNRGWRESKGDWIQFLDADDIILPHKISQQITLVAENPEASFVASRTIKSDLGSGQKNDWSVMEDPWLGLLQNRLGITSANLFSRQYLERAGGWDESLKSSQEYDLMFRMMKISDNVIIDNSNPLSVIRSRSEGSISSESKGANKHRFLRLMSEIGEYLKKEKPEVYADLDDTFFQDMFIRIRLNTIDGWEDSDLFYNQLMPTGFRSAAHAFNPVWFRCVHRFFGFGLADSIQRTRTKVKSSSS